MKLPPIRPWRVVLGCTAHGRPVGPENSVQDGIERAWRSYLDRDLLASRVELGKWLPQLGERGDAAELALALSLAKLDSENPQVPMSSLADDLTEAAPKWREKSDLTPWVNLFDGGVAAMHSDAAAAQQDWTEALHAPGTPPRLQGLASLGLADLALRAKSAQEALVQLQTAEQAFDLAKDTRGVAEVLILRIRAFDALGDRAKTASAAVTAESYSRRQELEDGSIEGLLANADAAAAFPDQEKATQAWARAEDEALHSGLMPVRALRQTEFAQLKVYARSDLSLAKSSEYFRWATKTGDLALIESAARSMAARLKESGEIGASGWYTVIAQDAATSLLVLPLRTRLLDAALIDYGLLETGVNPAVRPELFLGTEYRNSVKRLTGAFYRIAKLSPDDDLDDLNQLLSGLDVQATQIDRHREAVLVALERKDAKSAKTELAAFFENLRPFNQRLQELSSQMNNHPTQQARNEDLEPKMIYAAGLLEAWSMRNPSRLRDMISQLEKVGVQSNAPLLLPSGRASLAWSEGGVEGLSAKSDSDLLGLAVMRGKTPPSRSWPRLASEYAAAGGGSVVTAAAFGVDPDKLDEQEAAQFQIVYGTQFALANTDLPHIELGGAQNFDWLVRKMRKDWEIKHDFETASRFGQMMRLVQIAYLSTDRGAERLAKDHYFQFLMNEDLEMPDFDSLEDDEASGDENDPESASAQDDDQASGGENDQGNATPKQDDVAPKGFLRAFEFTSWSFQYPVLLYTVAYPGSDYLEKSMLQALADMKKNPRISGPLPFELQDQLGEIEAAHRLIVLDLALSAMADKRYGEAIRLLLNFERSLSPSASLDRIQVMYAEAMCYRGLGDGRREGILLRTAAERLETLRRAEGTRTASLRLRDLRQLIEEEYLSLLYRSHDWIGMAQAIAVYRHASLLPASVLATDPTHPLALELKSLKETYSALSEGQEDTPVTRQDYRQLLDLFGQPQRLPAGDPTLNALEQATYLVTDELYDATSRPAARGVSIRRADPGELLILESVGHSGVYTATIDERGRTAGFYRYISSSELESLSKDFEDALLAGGSSEKPGAQLYDKLLGYLPAMGGKKRLSILADGPLQNLAWAALPTPKGAFLIEPFEIGISSGAEPVLSRGPAKGHSRILAIMNPDTDSDSSGELAAISHGVHSKIISLADKSANLRSIREALAGSDAVFISTHGESDPLRPDYSFLELPDGHRLYSLDLGNLDFTGRQVLLSACDTRSGKTYGGEEIYGLADAFLARNAFAVVATRWRIEAPPAAAFSRAFYSGIGEGADYTAATAMAARGLLRGENSDWHSPQQWAAYEPVTRFFESGSIAPRLTNDSQRQDPKEAARIVETLKVVQNQAVLVGQQLTAKEASLKAEIVEVGSSVVLEGNRNSALYTQSKKGQRSDKFVAALLKDVQAALKANPNWRPPANLQLTVRVEDGAGKPVSGATVSAESVANEEQLSQLTNGNGIAIFTGLKAATAYAIRVSAKGYVRDLPLLESEEELDAWLGDADKVIQLRQVNAIEVEEQGPKRKLERAKVARKPAQVRLSSPKSPGPLWTLLDEINHLDASNQKIPAEIADSEADVAKAKSDLDEAKGETSKDQKDIDESHTKIEGEIRELNALLKQVQLPELKLEPLKISGTVSGANVQGLRAKVTLERVGAGVEETTYSDASGKFVLTRAAPGVEYTVSADAEGYPTFRTLAISFYFPTLLSISLKPAGDSGYQGRFW